MLGAWPWIREAPCAGLALSRCADGVHLGGLVAMPGLMPHLELSWLSCVEKWWMTHVRVTWHACLTPPPHPYSRASLHSLLLPQLQMHWGVRVGFGGWWHHPWVEPSGSVHILLILPAVPTPRGLTVALPPLPVARGSPEHTRAFASPCRGLRRVPAQHRSAHHCFCHLSTSLCPCVVLAPTTGCFALQRRLL